MSYERLIKSIIDETEMIVGPVAITQANKVKGLEITRIIKIKGDPQKIIKSLLENYKSIIGEVAVTIAKRGTKPILEKNLKLKVPEELR